MLDKPRLLKLLKMISEGHSYTEIIQTLRVGKDTIYHYKSFMNSHPISISDLEKMSDKELRRIFVNREERDQSKPLPDWEEVYQKVTRKKNRISLFKVWRMYKEENPNGYQ